LRELLLGQVAVVALQLLLGAQLQAEFRHLVLAALAMLAGAVGAAVHRGLRTTPDVFAHTAVDFVLGAMALGHRSSISVSTRPGPPPTGTTIPTAVHVSSVMFPRTTGRPGARKRGVCWHI